MTNYINLALYALLGYFFIKNKDQVGQLITNLVPGGGGQTQTTTSAPSTADDSGSGSSTTPTSGASVAGAAGSCGTHIYHAISAKSGGAGKNQGIHYASTGKAAISHRVDVQGFGGKTSLEATVWLTMPATCSDGGKNGVDIKFYGPNHSNGACCYCLCSMGVSGDVKFGGEGPHPKTNSNMKAAGSVGNVGGKKVGFKHVIWKGAQIHQEAWVNTTGTWKKVGEYDRPTCGFNKTSATPAGNAEVEFRSDCANVVYHCTEVAIISPPGGTQAAYVRRVIKRKAYRALNTAAVIGGGLC